MVDRAVVHSVADIIARAEKEGGAVLAVYMSGGAHTPVIVCPPAFDGVWSLIRRVYGSVGDTGAHLTPTAQQAMADSVCVSDAGLQSFLGVALANGAAGATDEELAAAVWLAERYCDGLFAMWRAYAACRIASGV